MGRLQDRVAVITGAGSGIGRAIARRFAEELARVAIGDIDGEAGQRVAREISEAGGIALALATDVTRVEQVEALFARTRAELGPVDILVNNAGIAEINPHSQEQVRARQRPRHWRAGSADHSE